MNSLMLIIIAATAIISYYGWQNPAVFEKYKFNVGAITRDKEYIRLVSAGFLHADPTHLIFNMLTLYFFGPVVQQFFGNLGFIFIYFGSVILGNLFSLYLYKYQSWYSAIGASGGVSGVIFAAIAMMPTLPIYFLFIPIGIPGFLFGLAYFAYSVYSMLKPRAHDNIGHAAHLGGAGFGIIYTILVLPQLALQNILFLLIMSLPLLYMFYVIFVQKKHR